ncbi:hypothetical protein [[Ruminococcus] lactaris]|uniref:hypothetical protein n=1 Tax=[Ruminococcus] lactaris TaxID=46228 RepID=UPI00242AE78F|nr:hypothetical protein [[Ruminococcus] lactaris]
MTDEVRDGGMNLLGKVDAWDNLIRIKSESVILFFGFFLWQAFCRLLMNIQIQIVESPIFLNFRSRSIPRSARSIKIFSNRKLLSHLTSFCYDNNNE